MLNPLCGHREREMTWLYLLVSALVKRFRANARFFPCGTWHLACKGSSLDETRGQTEGETMPKRPILVIDDDLQFCELITAGLTDLGFQVLSAHDGPSGI